MIFEINDYDFIDEIVRQGLIDTYLGLKQDLKQAEHRHPDDVVIWKRVVAAIEVLGEWYFTDFKADVKAAKRKRK